MGRRHHVVLHDDKPDTYIHTTKAIQQRGWGAMTTAARYAKLKREGRCLGCGKSDHGELTAGRCKVCHDKYLGAKINLRRRHYREKTCTRCGSRPATCGTCCQQCAKQKRVGMIKIYYKRIAEGLCYSCGVPSYGGLTLCPSCQGRKQHLRRSNI